MPALPDLETKLQVGDWRVDAGGNRLLRDGEVRPLRHKAMELLLLARRAGEEVFSAKHIQLGTGQAPALSAAVATDAGYLLTSDLGAVNTNVQ